MKTPRKLTIAEAAARLGVHRDTVGEWMRAGRISGERSGRRVLIPVAALSQLARRKCPACGKTYTATDPRRVFCSPRCAEVARDAAARARRAENPKRRGRPPKHAPADPARLALALAVVEAQRTGGTA